MNFSEAWVDYSERLHGQEVLAEYLKKELFSGKLIKECLTVGPGECKHECLLLDSCLTQLENLYLIEPDAVLNSMGNDAIKATNQNIKVHSFVGKIQDYEHKGNPLDVILIIQSVYYCWKKLPCLLEKFKSWLTKDGIIVFTTDSGSDGLTFESLGKDPADSDFSVCVPLNKLHEKIDEAGLLHKDGVVETTTKVADSDKSNFSWVEVQLNRPLKDDEIVTVKEIIEKRQQEEGDEIPEQVYVVIASKQSE